MRKFKQLFIGLVIGSLLTAIPVLADNIDVIFDNIKIFVNGSEVAMDTQPLIYKDRTYVPIRFVAEALGQEVNYNEATKSISIGVDVSNVAEWISIYAWGAIDKDVKILYSDGLTIIKGDIKLEIPDSEYPKDNSIKIVNTAYGNLTMARKDGITYFKIAELKAIGLMN